MSQRWRKYSPEFRRDALEKMKTCANVTELARQLGIRRKWLYQWRGDAEATGEPAAPAGDARRLQQLEALVARQSLELDFFKGAFERVEEQRRKRAQTSGPGSTSR